MPTAQSYCLNQGRGKVLCEMIERLEWRKPLPTAIWKLS